MLLLGRENGLGHFVRALLSAIILLLTISLCQAEPKCSDPAVLEAYAEIIKCKEILQCAGNPIRGTSRDLAKMSDAELRQRALKSAFDVLSPNLKTNPALVKLANFTAGLKSSLLIGWRDAFRSMKVSATTIAYDPGLRRYSCQGRFSFDPSLLSEAMRRNMLALELRKPKKIESVFFQLAANQDPMLLLAESAKRTEGAEKCINTNRIFYLQPTGESRFVVALDQNAIAPGCRKASRYQNPVSGVRLTRAVPGEAATAPAPRSGFEVDARYGQPAIELASKPAAIGGTE